MARVRRKRGASRVSTSRAEPSDAEHNQRNDAQGLPAAEAGIAGDDDAGQNLDPQAVEAGGVANDNDNQEGAPANIPENPPELVQNPPRRSRGRPKKSLRGANLRRQREDQEVDEVQNDQIDNHQPDVTGLVINDVDEVQVVQELPAAEAVEARIADYDEAGQNLEAQAVEAEGIANDNDNQEEAPANIPENPPELVQNPPRRSRGRPKKSLRGANLRRQREDQEVDEVQNDQIDNHEPDVEVINLADEDEVHGAEEAAVAEPAAVFFLPNGQELRPVDIIVQAFIDQAHFADDIQNVSDQNLRQAEVIAKTPIRAAEMSPNGDRVRAVADRLRLAQERRPEENRQHPCDQAILDRNRADEERTIGINQERGIAPVALIDVNQHFENNVYIPNYIKVRVKIENHADRVLYKLTRVSGDNPWKGILLVRITEGDENIEPLALNRCRRIHNERIQANLKNILSKEQVNAPPNVPLILDTLFLEQRVLREAMMNVSKFDAILVTSTKREKSIPYAIRLFGMGLCRTIVAYGMQVETIKNIEIGLNNYIYLQKLEHHTNNEEAIEFIDRWNHVLKRNEEFVRDHGRQILQPNTQNVIPSTIRSSRRHGNEWREELREQVEGDDEDDDEDEEDDEASRNAVNGAAVRAMRNEMHEAVMDMIRLIDNDMNNILPRRRNFDRILQRINGMSGREIMEEYRLPEHLRHQEANGPRQLVQPLPQPVQPIHHIPPPPQQVQLLPQPVQRHQHLVPPVQRQQHLVPPAQRLHHLMPPPHHLPDPLTATRLQVGALAQVLQSRTSPPPDPNAERERCQPHSPPRRLPNIAQRQEVNNNAEPPHNERAVQVIEPEPAAPDELEVDDDALRQLDAAAEADRRRLEALRVLRFQLRPVIEILDEVRPPGGDEEPFINVEDDEIDEEDDNYYNNICYLAENKSDNAEHTNAVVAQVLEIFPDVSPAWIASRSKYPVPRIIEFIMNNQENNVVPRLKQKKTPQQVASEKKRRSSKQLQHGVGTKRAKMQATQSFGAYIATANPPEDVKDAGTNDLVKALSFENVLWYKRDSESEEYGHRDTTNLYNLLKSAFPLVKLPHIKRLQNRFELLDLFILMELLQLGRTDLLNKIIGPGENGSDTDMKLEDMAWLPLKNARKAEIGQFYFNPDMVAPWRKYKQIIEKYIPREAPQLECIICFEKHDETFCCRCTHIEAGDGEAPTSHIVCSECLEGHAGVLAEGEGSLGKGGVGIPCASLGCTGVVLWAHAEAHMNPNLRDRIEKRINHEALLGMDNLEKCNNCDYALIIEESPEERRVFYCLNPACSSSHCRHCKREWNELHFGKRCDEMVDDDRINRRKELEEQLTMSFFRQCSKCSMVFEKERGCNRMLCRCGQQTCYICRKAITGYDHFCRHVRDPNGPNVCPVKCGKNCLLFEDSMDADKHTFQRVVVEARNDELLDPAEVNQLVKPKLKKMNGKK